MTPARFVYLHGFASGPASRKARFFHARFRESGIPLEVPDLAAGDFENLTITGQLAIIERLCGGSPATLIGSSLGGYLAALYAARHPEVERLVLMAPAFAFARRWTSWLGEEQVATWRRTGYTEIYHYGDKRPRRLGYGLVEDAARYEDYPGIRQPALIFHGTQDEAVPVEYSRQFAAGRENVRLEVVEAGHELIEVLDHIWDAARRFCKVCSLRLSSQVQ